MVLHVPRLPAADSPDPGLHPFAERWIDDERVQGLPASDPPGWALGTPHPRARRDAASTGRRIR